MDVAYYLRRVRETPPRELVGKCVQTLWRHAAASIHRRRDWRNPTYAVVGNAPEGALNRQFEAPSLDLLTTHQTVIARLAKRVLAHEFDLLGSGWVEVGFPGSDVPGIDGIRYNAALAQQPPVNRANLDRSRQLAARLPDAYRRIDWQRDFVSGFRWSEQTWSSEVEYGKAPGADIKVPWELGRLQHLPWLAWAAALAGKRLPHFAESSRYRDEFVQQVTDFISANPPRFGCQWMCTMDVAIRAANLVIAHDMFLSLGFELPDEFELDLKTSLYEHGLHITNHLEWNPSARGNHYYADLAGLILVAAALPACDTTDHWLEFAIREFLNETERQFHADGSNFEASTAYHRLSSEMLVFATLAIGCLTDQRWQRVQTAARSAESYHPGPMTEWPVDPQSRSAVTNLLLKRLEGAAWFSRHSTRPDGQIVQVGDNDSGRFARLLPELFDNCDDDQDDQLNHRHLRAAVAGFLSEGSVVDGPDAHPLAQDIDFAVVRQSLAQAPGSLETSGFSARPMTASPPDSGSAAFPDFGLYTLWNEQAWISFRCGHVGQDGNGGHAHNDQLSFELCLADRPLIVDPGTYVYTALPEQRNRFRSTASHNTLMLESLEQNPWIEGAQGLFQLRDRCHPSVIECTPSRIEAQHTGYSEPHRRIIELTEHELIGFDRCDAVGTRRLTFQLNSDLDARIGSDKSGVQLLRAGIRVAEIHCDAGHWKIQPGEYSRGYGHRQPALTCTLESTATELHWRIRW